MNGYFIQRDQNNHIIGAFSQPQPGIAEEFFNGEPDLYHPLSWEEIRAQRNAQLSQCDWTQLADAPLSAELKTAWKTYRQALRDITEAFESPDDVQWPVSP